MNVKIITDVLNTKKFYFHLYKIIHKVKYYYLHIKTIGIYISLVYIFIYKPNYVKPNQQKHISKLSTFTQIKLYLFIKPNLKK